MAVAIPLVMTAMGASAVVTTLTTIAFAVTGISAKINKAAANVFGEDLTMAANLFGAAFMAFGGAGGAAAGEAGSSAAGSANGMWDVLPEAVGAGEAAAGAASGADAFAAAGLEANAAGAGFFEQLTGDADAIASMGGDGKEFLEAASATQQQPGNVIDLLNDRTAPQQVQEQVAQQPSSNMPTSGAASPQGQNTNATSAQAAAPVKGPGQVTAPPQAPRSFFDRLLFDGKGNINPATLRVGGNILAGYGQSAEARRRQQAAMDFERERANQLPNLRVTG